MKIVADENVPLLKNFLGSLGKLSLFPEETSAGMMSLMRMY